MSENERLAYPLQISVIICAYTEERWDDLCAAVAGIEEQSLPPIELIVVIDHNDKLLERARREWQEPGMFAREFVENREKRGLSGARNTGLAMARGELIAFMDEDAIPKPDWLEQLARCYANPQVIGAGGVIEPLWAGKRPAWFPPEFDWVVGCTYLGMPLQAAPVRNLIGCNMSFRREVFETAGNFRDGIGRVGRHPAGCEETELCIRARQRIRQGVFLFQPAAQVRHRVPPSRMTWQYFRRRCFAEGISKALVTLSVGSQDGLAAERSYTLKTLPTGVVRGLADAARGDLAGLARAGAIAAGLLITAAGYLVGSIARRKRELAGSTQPAFSTAGGETGQLKDTL